MAPLFFIPIQEDFRSSSMADVASAELLGFETMKELFGTEFASRAQEIASSLGGDNWNKCTRSRDRFNRRSRCWGNRNKCTMKTSSESYVNDGKEFKVTLDVEQFKPEELKITLVKDELIIEGKQEERTDEYGSISRMFIRKYKIPDDVDEGALVSKLSPDGLFTLQAPKKIKEDEQGFKEIPIIRSGQASEMGHDVTLPSSSSVENHPDV